MTYSIAACAAICTDLTGNTVPLLQCDCCLAAAWRIPLLPAQQDSWPYFSVSDSRLPFSSPPTIRRVTVEVFYPASTRVWFRINYVPPFYNFGARQIKVTTSKSSSITACLFVAAETYLASRYLAMDYSGFQASCHNIYWQLSYQADWHKDRPWSVNSDGEADG
jgi:hypothetical protein